MKLAQTMTAKILSGREASAALLNTLTLRVNEMQALQERAPKLVVIQVGDNPSSGAYIRQKQKAALQCGYGYEHIRLPRNASFAEVHAQIDTIGRHPLVDGMILQLPLDTDNIAPDQVDLLVHAIPPEKDADGLHPLNQGYLFSGASSAQENSISAHPIPATALGVVRLLQHNKISLSGAEVVVVGRSRLVGAPVAALLMNLGATVTICHSKTRNLAAHTRRAEILVVAAGKKHLIRSEHVAPGAIVIDVGIHVDDDGKLTGDVHPSVHTLAGAYSPVPGGVGPMTVAGLMENTLLLRLPKDI